jgi:hypothetical protein
MVSAISAIVGQRCSFLKRGVRKLLEVTLSVKRPWIDAYDALTMAHP